MSQSGVHEISDPYPCIVKNEDRALVLLSIADVLHEGEGYSSR